MPWGGVYRSPATSTSPTYFTMVTDDRGDVIELLDAAGNPFACYHYELWGLQASARMTSTALRPRAPA